MLFQDNTGFEDQRKAMVENQIRARGVRDERVLAALGKVPRHFFVSPFLHAQAYDDKPLAIDQEQAISQPYIVAFMTEALHLKPSDKVLEIGTGSGYQTAVVAELAGEVYTVERIRLLADQAAERLRTLGYNRVHTRWGDGSRGWPEAAPFDAILVSAAAPAIPSALKDQLAEGGRLILPVGENSQTLRLVYKSHGRFEEHTVMDVRFVPMLPGQKE